MRGVASVCIWTLSVTCLSSILVTCLSATTMTRLQTHTAARDSWEADAAAAVREVIQASSRGEISLIIITDKSFPGEDEMLLRTSRGVALFEAAGNKPNSSRLVQVIAWARQVRWASWMVVVVLVSDDPAFLAVFAQKSYEGRLFVSETRFIVVTRRVLPSLHPLHQTLAVTNSLLLLPDGTTDVQSLRGRRLWSVSAWVILPYRSPAVAPLRVATWTRGRGLNLHRNLFCDKFNKHYGKMSLLLGMERSQRHTVVMLPDPTAPGGVRQHFKGLMIPVLDYLGQALNFSYTFRRPLDGLYGGKTPNGSYSGMIGQVQRQEVHFAVGPFAINAERYEVVDFTWPFYFMSGKVLGGRGSPEVDPWSFVYPLTSGVWATLLASLLLVSVVSFLFTARFSHGILGYESLATKHLQYVSIVLRQCEPEDSAEGLWGRVVLGVWMLMTFVLTRCYESNLMSMLAVRYMSQPYQTLRDVLDNPGVGMILHKDSTFIQYVREATSGILQEVKESGKRGRFTFLSVFEFTNSNVLEEVIQQRKVFADYDYSLIATRSTHFSRTGRCDFYMGRENIMADRLNFVIQKDSPLIPAFNARIISMIEAGLFDYWSAESTPNISLCNRVPTKITVSSSLSLRQCWAMLVVLAGGLVVGLATAVIEVGLGGVLRAGGGGGGCGLLAPIRY